MYSIIQALHLRNCCVCVRTFVRSALALTPRSLLLPVLGHRAALAGCGWWMGVAVALLNLAASERKICTRCHGAAVPLASTGKQPPRSRWGDELGMVPGWVSAMSRSLSRLLRTWRSRCEVHVAPLPYTAAPLGDILHISSRRHASWRTNDTGSPHDFIPLKAPARHNSFFMASPQQSRIQSYLEKNKIGPLFEVSAQMQPRPPKLSAANLKPHCSAPAGINPLLFIVGANWWAHICNVSCLTGVTEDVLKRITALYTSYSCSQTLHC